MEVFQLNQRLVKLVILMFATLSIVLTYQFVNIDIAIFDYAISIRTPKLIGIIIAAACIGVATIIFQSVISNYIVTPCLLGMNAMYIMIHTITYSFFGSMSIFATSKNLSFLINIIIMSVTATLLYGFLFKKTNYNVLYVLLTGTVLATLFSSVSNSLIRVMDPNEFASLQNKIIPGFSNINSDLIAISIALITLVVIVFWKELRLLDVISLGKDQAINLGVDFDRTVSKLLIAVTFLITIATALVGPISFVGLIIANISREFFKTYKHSYLIVGAALLGVFILVLGQTVIEHLLSYGTAINVFVDIFGGLYFIFLVLKNNGGNA